REPVDAVIAMDDTIADRFFELLLGRLRRHDFFQRDFKEASRIFDVPRTEDIARQPLARFSGFENAPRDPMAKLIRRTFERTSERKPDKPHQGPDPFGGEVV